ncbi:MAG: response regulator [Bacteroidota bacterium]|nr:response regulator [Bacteroidota bacterium]
MDTKIKCLILDDELPGLAYLKMLCEQIDDLEVVKAFNDPEVFLKELPCLEFDFCILDIQMPGIDGLSIANLMGNIPVIFTTAYKEYAAEAFDLDAVDYVRKPIQKERLEKAVDKVKERLKRKSQSRKFVQLNTDKGKTLLFFDQVCYISPSEIDSRDKYVLLNEGESLILKNTSFEQLLSFLPSDKFCRVNKKEIIALKCVKFFSYDEIVTNIPDCADKTKVLTLGDVFRNEFLKKLHP